MKDLKALSKHQILSRIEILQQEIETYKPLSKEQEGKVVQKLRLDWNYHSTAIEGNSLNYGETIAFLMHGVTAKGKPLKDHLDIKGHNQAIDFLMAIIKSKRTLSEKDLRELHALILVEPYESNAITPDGLPTKKLIKLAQYKTSPNSVRTNTGEMHYYATPEETPILVAQLVKKHKENVEDKAIHPLVAAAYFHHRFVEIHPFDDGNGRVARLIMNLTLMEKEFPPVVIKQEERSVYYSCLAQADAGNLEPLVEFIAENLIRSLEIYLKGAKGEDLSEPDDLAKEVALFKMELEGKKDVLKNSRTKETLEETFKTSLNPLLIELDKTLTPVKDLFFDFDVFLVEEKKKNDFEYVPIADAVEYVNKIEKTKDMSELRFSFRLGYFKSETNSFGLSLSLITVFDKTQYYFQYEIHGGLSMQEMGVTPSFRYYQQLDTIQIKAFCTEIGKNMLKYTKILYEDPHYMNPRFSF